MNHGKKTVRRLRTRFIRSVLKCLIIGVPITIPINVVYAQQMHVEQNEQEVQQVVTNGEEMSLEETPQNLAEGTIKVEQNSVPIESDAMQPRSEPSESNSPIEPSVEQAGENNVVEQPVQELMPKEENLAETETTEVTSTELMAAEPSVSGNDVKLDEANTKSEEGSESDTTKNEEEVETPDTTTTQEVTQGSVSGNEVEGTGLEVTALQEIVMYENPDSNSKRVTTLAEGSMLTNVEEQKEGGWLKVHYDGEEGYVCYVRTDYLEKVEKVIVIQEVYDEAKPAVVNGDNVNLRKFPGITEDVVISAEKGRKLKVISYNHLLYKEEVGWYLVEDAESGEQAYIYGEYLHFGTELPQKAKREVVQTVDTNANQTLQAPSAVNGQAIVSYAQQFLGIKYVYGAAGPSAFDCSGFTMYVYAQFGVSLCHNAAAQSKMGVSIPIENLQPGDLVFFKDKTMSRVGHCGIYIGNGNFIHASSGSGTCVKISSLTGTYSRRYCGARRIV